MILYTRRVLFAGPPDKVAEYATGMCAYASEATGLDVSLWQGIAGAPLGSMTYSMRVESIADQQAAVAKLTSDAGYASRLAVGREFIAAPSQDSFAAPVVGDFADESPPLGSYVSFTSATIRNGAYEAAFAWGADMAQHSSSVTGIPTMFLRSLYGAFGTVGWIAVAPDASAVDAARAALDGDADYMKKLGAAGELFAEGSGHQELSVRVA